MKTAVRDVFAVAAAAYDRGNPLLALERPDTEALLPVLAGRDVLDVGAGTGHYARLAAALGARIAIAFDLTPGVGFAPRGNVTLSLDGVLLLGPAHSEYRLAPVHGAVQARLKVLF